MGGFVATMFKKIKSFAGFRMVDDQLHENILSLKVNRPDPPTAITRIDRFVLGGQGNLHGMKESLKTRAKFYYMSLVVSLNGPEVRVSLFKPYAIRSGPFSFFSLNFFNSSFSIYFMYFDKISFCLH